MVEAAGDAVVTLQESGFIPAEPTFFQRNRYLVAAWFAGLRDDIRQTSTLITIGLTLSSRLIIRRSSKRFLLVSLSAAVLGQVGWMRWKRSTAEKLEADLAEKENNDRQEAIAGPAESANRDDDDDGESSSSLAPPPLAKDGGGASATGISSGSQGDGTADPSDGEMKDLLTPATLYYLHDWIPASSTLEKSLSPSSDPDIKAGDVAAAVAAAERQDQDHLTDDDYDDDLTAVVVAADAPVPAEEPKVVKKHVLVRSLPANFTEIAMNVRMIDDHLLSSYRRALDNILWEDDELL
ncbi:hypothetical protein HDU86_005730 [Geranomyces michiganensis]|nr:hypothetical protein HDU86_005730 [Geranomyces michiganensis]